ncbi:MAG: DUF4367 domain-containing protein [Clostridia bacterium]|nr:DUF4367 domain-containing protein [Clostridia bacterium]
MVKKGRDEAIFDAIISRAFADAAMEDIEELQKADVPEVELSARHKREEKRLYRRIEKVKNSPAQHCIINKIVASVIICVAIGMTMVFSIPSIRADVMKLIARPFEKYTSFGAATDSIFEDAEYSFGYIPEDFELVKYEKGVCRKFLYKNPFDGKYVNIIYCSDTNVNMLQDNENAEVTQTRINGNNAYVINNIDGTTEFVWSDGSNVINVSGDIDMDKMLRICKEIKICK